MLEPTNTTKKGHENEKQTNGFSYRQGVPHPYNSTPSPNRDSFNFFKPHPEIDPITWAVFVYSL
jgi:hypothetical protein